MKKELENHPVSFFRAAKNTPLHCRLGNLDEVWQLHHLIPELRPLESREVLLNRCGERDVLAFIAFWQEQPVGYKLGYGLSCQVFYSWLGGVIPSCRRRGVALALMLAQEQTVRERGYQRIEVKTMAAFPGMIHLLKRRGYRLDGYETLGGKAHQKMLFSKDLLKEHS